MRNKFLLSSIFTDVAEGWDLSNAQFNGGQFSVSDQETLPAGVFFKPDGTKMYTIGGFGRGKPKSVNEYNLSTAWDVTTASHLQNFSVAADETIPTGVFFKPDGTKMYVIGNYGVVVFEYDLLTAWDVTTASYLQFFDSSPQELTPQGVFFKPDGTKMYVIGSSGDDVNEYNLSTAWDVTTASYIQNFSVAASFPTDVFFKPDGTKMYVLRSNANDVNEYNLSTAWDVSTASYIQSFSVASQDLNSEGVFFKPDGTKMYVIGSSGDAVYEYDL